MAETANQIFLPWVQPGIAAHIPNEATDKLTANQPAFVSLSVKLLVNANTVPKTVRLLGPGQVTGIDPQQVVRVEPRPQTTDFEPNYFPAIEFDRPDFPWLFTPAKGGEQGRLRPWLCLVVVRKQQGVELRPAGELPQPVLTIQAPARPGVELPDLSESHIWAHAQITGTEKSQLKSAIATDPTWSVSRLLCPRRLDPTTEYIACVVPSFEVGRKAGLNQQILPADEQQLKPAWLSGSQSPAEIALPVYYSWEFRTGSGGDFEALVRRLEPRELPPEVGKRPMDISHPGFRLQPEPQAGAPGTILGLEGALRVAGREPDGWPDAVRLPFQTSLAKILNTPWEMATQNSDGKDAIVAPPIYGCWQAAIHTVGTKPAPLLAPWLDELNLDPRYRATAALGTRVIQTQQEALMVAAWAQLGEIQKINQRLRQAQLSRAVNTLYYQSFNRFSPEVFLKIVAPAQSRLVVASQSPNQLLNTPPAQTRLVQKLTASVGSSSPVSAPTRRLSRPRGPINRQYAQAGAQGIGSLVMLSSQSSEERQPNASSGEITWIDDNTPAGAILDGTNEGWNWVSATPTPYNGTRIHQSSAIAVGHQHFFYNATDKLAIANGDKLFAYIRLEISNAPRTVINVPNQIMLQWHTENNWEHRAYWRLLGNDELGWGVEGTASRRRVAGYPIVGGWVRLEVPAAEVGLEGKTLDGMAFTLVGGGLVSWGRAGKISRINRGAVTIDQISDRLPVGGKYKWVESPPPHWERPRAVDVQMHDTLRFTTLTDLSARQPTPTTPPEFYEAEMSRELLWRGYPTDQRGTYFQHFWDALDPGAPADIPPIHQWGDRKLGENAIAAAGSNKLVLLIRGELLRRHPNTVIYAVKAVSNGSARDLSTDPDETLHPRFRGTLEPDVTFIGFDLTPAEVVAGLGWYFVLQQQPTEPRFGLDDAPFSADKVGAGEASVIPELKTWNDLNWAHLAPSREALQQLSHLPVNPIDLQPTTPNLKGIWGRNSAHMAYITRQQPVRVAIHATELIR